MSKAVQNMEGGWYHHDRWCALLLPMCDLEATNMNVQNSLI